MKHHDGTPNWYKPSPRRDPTNLARFYNLNIDEREVAKEAAEAVRDYRENPPMGTGSAYEGETADDVVSEALPDAHPRRKAAILDVALAIAEHEGVDLSSRRDAADYGEEAA